MECLRGCFRLRLRSGSGSDHFSKIFRVGAPRVYASDILGNAALEGELTIARLDAEGAEVILTYKQGSRMGATVLNQRVIMLNVPKDVPVKSFKIIYPHTAAAQKYIRRK